MNSDDLSRSTACAVVTKDWESRRKAGSALWGGWAGTGFVIDPQTGIAFVFGSQIVPAWPTLEIAEKAERIIYAHLED
ncbi:hypothetical protein CC2G_004285 [Coprinopsis cinerea AmutBmut pab1-1]|nr:hypothetical protein CC2G_004285 [Coprinopsis cinerea AmutBmut pab1-1]